VNSSTAGTNLPTKLDREFGLYEGSGDSIAAQHTLD
jgi:hypothetical protein